MNRRTLLKSAFAASIPMVAVAADMELELSPANAGPEIGLHIYGHFIEHLGGVIYDGIWVGKNSKVPQVNGIRKRFVLCRLTGAAPYLAANVASASPQEFHDWITYCNAPAGTATLADQRAANGDAEPFNVRFWESETSHGIAAACSNQPSTPLFIACSPASSPLMDVHGLPAHPGFIGSIDIRRVVCDARQRSRH